MKLIQIYCPNSGSDDNQGYHGQYYNYEFTISEVRENTTYSDSIHIDFITDPTNRSEEDGRRPYYHVLENEAKILRTL